MSHFFLYPQIGHYVYRPGPPFYVGSVKFFHPLTTIPETILSLDENMKIIPIGVSLHRNRDNGQIIVTKGDVEITGKLVRKTDDVIIITGQYDNDEIIIRNWDKVTYISSEGTAIKGGWARMSSLSFLFEKIMWKCLGIVVVTGEQLQLRLMAEITNNCETTIDGNITVIAGHIKHPPTARLMAAAPMASSPASSINSEEYISYDLGHHIIDDNALINIKTLTLATRKLYRHITGTSATSFGYLMQAPEALPNCHINIFTAMPMTKFVGSTYLELTAKNEEVLLEVGESTNVVTTSTIAATDKEVTRKVGDRTETLINRTEIITVIITNNSDADIQERIAHFVGDRTITTVKFYNINPYTSPVPIKGYLLIESPVVHAQSIYELTFTVETTSILNK